MYKYKVEVLNVDLPNMDSKKYDKYILTSVIPKKIDIEENLNYWAADGWKLVSTFRTKEMHLLADNKEMCVETLKGIFEKSSK